ncbi:MULTISPECIES: type III secretion system translocator chaperone SicA [unclassified Undibacterium]|uniref:type III secretion system translocator chaperone SicA n=1 Tax=unclassified Undibacterium TaxID=2630295 RepID=UPI002AC90E81|nr:MULTISPECIES: type III secretion system translocator chaperone SicA [unclassified Undibacterium]MEB0140384.1 type III secretion system translocator chaperone SicA [Undibacterium sp. CCC2.1]MEB0173418.1 type III secretion system translocator chaperone SicA [Undibacterium sp. CCC1.1]MEB0177318.1 type III secretion system translocator chaperone SicA [Undibacterium sp. CCC3.4]MEB0216575.1 type III secretion system translocator chaperone SicA [Undibacterium sp. 5I2]WPX43477.1 type III secretion 
MIVNDDQLATDETAKLIVEAVENGATLKDLYGISDEMMDKLYALAYDFYSNGRLDDAEKFFRFLCIYDFNNSQYLMGLAAVAQLKKNYQKAIDLYVLAFALAKNDYGPVFYTGQCHMYLQRTAKARLCFELVCLHSHEETLRAKASAYLEALQDVQATEASEESDVELSPDGDLLKK